MRSEFFSSIYFNIFLTIIFGIVISYIDLHNDEVQPAVLLLLIFSFILGYKHPPKAWLYCFLIGLSIITGYLIAKAINFTPKGPPPNNIFSSLIALIPAFIGGYCGVLIKNIFRKAIS